MLKRTFCHFPGIGLATEARLWSGGIEDWGDFAARGAEVVGRGKVATAMSHLESSLAALEAGRADHFFTSLPAAHQWRAFADFRHRAAYLDIETTGMGPGTGITTIALYDGTSVRTYVQGRNLADFEKDVADYALLVTFNGKCFDVPILERAFNMRLPGAHIDLRYVLKALGYSGGLKACEKSFGLNRGGLDGVDGFFAVILWNEYRRTGDERVLETLRAYNAADVLGLETLMFAAFNQHLEQTPFYARSALETPRTQANPHVAHADVVARLMEQRWAYPSW
jgi:uncharacterized protein YprB with RNaseH-like and TPR domain